MKENLIKLSHNLIFGVRIKDVNLGDMPAESGIKVENGVLKVTMPKSEEAKPKKIQVKSVGK